MIILQPVEEVYQCHDSWKFKATPPNVPPKKSQPLRDYQQPWSPLMNPGILAELGGFCPSDSYETRGSPAILQQFSLFFSTQTKTVKKTWESKTHSRGNTYLVGGFNPFENISQVGMKIKNIWNRHLDHQLDLVTNVPVMTCFFSLRTDS